MEFASFFRTMGADVTIVEVLPQILPVEDAEVAAFARKSFEKQGIKILTGAKVTKLDKKSDSVVATIDDGKGKTQTLEVERVISAVGVVGNVENLGLEKLGVKVDRGSVVVDGLGRTNVTGIYAIGDVAARQCWRTRRSMRASSASRRSRDCIRIRSTRTSFRAAPTASHRSPPSADRGKGERAGTRHPRRQIPLRRQRQGDCARRGSGLHQGRLRQEDRTTARRTHGRRGSHRADPGLRGRDKSRDDRRGVIHTVFPHPTLSEMMKEAVLDAYGRVLNI